MARAKYNVLVIPFTREKSEAEYCIFKRKDMRIWQFIAGGGEDDELPTMAARRESYEEAGIASSYPMIPLKSMCYVPANVFSEKAQEAWGNETIVIPVYTFATELKTSKEIVISREHEEYFWCNFQKAYGFLHFDLDKTALYEINETIKRNLLCSF